RRYFSSNVAVVTLSPFQRNFAFSEVIVIVADCPQAICPSGAWVIVSTGSLGGSGLGSGFMITGGFGDGSSPPQENAITPRAMSIRVSIFFIFFLSFVFKNFILDIS